MKADLPFGVPPILSDIKSKIQDFLENPQLLPLHDLDRVQQFWKPECNPHFLCQIEAAPTPTTIYVERDLISGGPDKAVEIAIPQAGMSNKTSMSLQRAPGNLFPITQINLLSKSY